MSTPSPHAQPAEVARPAASATGDGPVRGGASSTGQRPRVKICGLTSVADTLRAAELGADLIGLNFHAPSPRSLPIADAERLVKEVREVLSPASAPLFVGIFVHQSPSEAAAIGQRVGLDLLQFHGEHGVADVAPVAERALIALRVKDRLDADVLAEWLDVGVWGMVIDSRHESLYGGSGESWDFSSLGRIDGVVAERLAGLRLLIAGGIRPDNVAAAVRAADPWGIDVASGVESEPGIKDPELMAALFEEIRHG